MNNATHEFLKTVRLAFPVFQENEKRFFHDLESSVDAYAEHFPSCSIADLTEQFGEPKDIVYTYFNNMESRVYLSVMREARYHKIITFVVIIFLSLMLAVTFGFWISTKQSTEGDTIHQKETSLDSINYTSLDTIDYHTREDLP